MLGGEGGRKVVLRKIKRGGKTKAVAVNTQRRIRNTSRW